MVEIASNGPNVQQKVVAKRLNITPQAVSDYIAQLVKEKMLISEGRSSYRLTNEGVNWIIKMLRELSSYTDYVQRAITNISICTAIAEGELKEGQRVGLEMKGGLLFATNNPSGQATGVVISSARAGEDVGITSIEGIVPLQVGKVTVLRVPGVQRGGSRRANLAKLKEYVKKSSLTVSLGLEAFVALQKIGVEPCRYGAAEVVAEAAKSGLNPLVVCVENETSALLAKLEEEKIAYEIVEITS